MQGVMLLQVPLAIQLLTINESKDKYKALNKHYNAFINSAMKPPKPKRQFFSGNTPTLLILHTKVGVVHIFISEIKNYSSINDG